MNRYFTDDLEISFDDSNKRNSDEEDSKGQLSIGKIILKCRKIKTDFGLARFFLDKYIKPVLNISVFL